MPPTATITNLLRHQEDDASALSAALIASSQYSLDIALCWLIVQLSFARGQQTHAVSRIRRVDHSVEASKLLA